MVQDCPNPGYGLNDASVIPDVDYAAMVGFLAVRRPGGYIARLDLQDGFLH